MLSFKTHIFSLFLFIALNACVSQKILKKQFDNQGYCNISSTESLLYDNEWREKIKRDTLIDSTIVSRFSKRSRSVAADIGILSLLREYVKYEDKGNELSIVESYRYLKIRQMIGERISLAFIEISSVLSELECEQDLANEINIYLQSETERIARRNTILSLVVGTVSNLSSIYSLDESIQKYLSAEAVITTLLASYWALRTTKIRRAVVYKHQRNLLRDIWENPDDASFFPPMVWQFLSREFEIDNKGREIRNIIMDKWNELGFMDLSKPEEFVRRTRLWFGEGGVYNLEDIQIRLSMLDLLETEVASMNQELKQLRQEILLKELIEDK